jgi:hypothetical protein
VYEYLILELLAQGGTPVYTMCGLVVSFGMVRPVPKKGVARPVSAMTASKQETFIFGLVEGIYGIHRLNNIELNGLGRGNPRFLFRSRRLWEKSQVLLSQSMLALLKAWDFI